MLSPNRCGTVAAIGGGTMSPRLLDGLASQRPRGFRIAVLAGLVAFAAPAPAATRKGPAAATCQRETVATGTVKTVDAKGAVTGLRGLLLKPDLQSLPD